MADYDDLADELNSTGKMPHPGAGNCKVTNLFGDSPKLLEAILTARTERHLSADHVAKWLTKKTGKTIGKGAIVGYWTRNGVE